VFHLIQGCSKSLRHPFIRDELSAHWAKGRIREYNDTRSSSSNSYCYTLDTTSRFILDHYHNQVSILKRISLQIINGFGDQKLTLTMPSLTIIWNGVFSRKRHYRPFAAKRINRHFRLKRLWRYRPRIMFAIVRYVVLASFLGFASSCVGPDGTAKVGMIGVGAVISRSISRRATDSISRPIMFTRATRRIRRFAISDVG
jgi:hypothetical protein